ncbi:nuclear transport factor 2 family protein [Amycolatopsis jejuensis]|uniref:nuclear transport factor 2 family protein n=1 Tax=Amycolatopsis jejuensis TaxID=330084 RepID=UPI000524BB15|nr:nuclear transport factor 2 family protein [Amycolatopsis jejuensis]
MTVDLTARMAIADLNARFAWALDLHDWDALREVFTVDVHYESNGREFDDRESAIASFRARPEARVTRHGLGNLLLLHGSDGAVLGHGSWHTFASNDPAVKGVPLFMVADFHDTYTHHADGWRIAERFIVPVFREDTLAPERIDVC